MLKSAFAAADGVVAVKSRSNCMHNVPSSFCQEVLWGRIRMSREHSNDVREHEATATRWQRCDRSRDTAGLDTGQGDRAPLPSRCTPWRDGRRLMRPRGPLNESNSWSKPMHIQNNPTNCTTRLGVMLSPPTEAGAGARAHEKAFPNSLRGEQPCIC
jgi:hypothetical protein